MKLTGSCFFANALIVRGRGDDYFALAVWVEECRTLRCRLRTLGQWVRHKVKLSAGEPANLPSAQISGDAPPQFINRCGGLKIGVR
jgi:hypothetical protein